MLSQTEFFQSLGAPLQDFRRSWGGVRAGDSAIFLRVWQDETRRIDGKLYTMITARKWFADDPANFGNSERLRHVEAIRAGASAFAVMCLAEDPSASPRTIRSFDDRDLFIGGGLMAFEGEEWLELVDKVSVSKLRTNKSPEPTRRE